MCFFSKLWRNTWRVLNNLKGSRIPTMRVELKSRLTHIADTTEFWIWKCFTWILTLLVLYPWESREKGLKARCHKYYSEKNCDTTVVVDVAQVKCKSQAEQLRLHLELWCRLYAWPSCTCVQWKCTPFSVHLYFRT